MAGHQTVGSPAEGEILRDDLADYCVNVTKVALSTPRLSVGGGK
jgi:hypothetical protein